ERAPGLCLGPLAPVDQEIVEGFGEEQRRAECERGACRAERRDRLVRQERIVDGEHDRTGIRCGRVEDRARLDLRRLRAFRVGVEQLGGYLQAVGQVVV